MIKDTQTTTITKTIQEEQKMLVLKFTPEEAKILSILGVTSVMDRMAMLDKCQYSLEKNPKNKECAVLLGEIFFAARDFNDDF